MTQVPHRFAFVFALFAAIAAAGCSVGEGGVCQIDDDCSEGLTCCPRGRSVTERGTCESTCTEPPRPDSGPRDSGPDAPAVDSGPVDSGTEDAGETDAAMDDAGGEDAGVEEDAGGGEDAGGAEDAGSAEDAGAAEDAG